MDCLKMDKSKEINKRAVSDSKKVSLKNNHLGVKSNTPRKFAYISRSKHVPFDNKKYIYSDSKSCDKCSHLSVKAPPPQVANVDHDLNGNFSFNQHSSFCNFPSVSEVPSFGLSYQQRYDPSVQKTSKHRKSGYHEKRAFNSKATNSKVPFHTNKFFSSVPHSSFSYQNSKGTRGHLSSNIPLVKFPGNRVCGSELSEKFPGCYLTTHLIRDPYLQGNVTIVSDDPFFAPSIITDKPGYTFQVEQEAHLLNLKSDYFIHNWQQISVSSLFENSADIKDATLNTNVPNEQVKSNFQATPEFSDRSKLESSDSIPSVVPATSSLETSVMCAIPQASYADVIRMSATCTGCVDTGKMSDSEKKDEKSQTDCSPEDSKSQELKTSQNIHATVVNLEKPSFYNSTNKNISSALSPPSERYIKGDLENVDKMSSSSSAYSSNFPSELTISMIDGQALSSKPDSMYSSASSVSSSTNAPVGKKIKPVIIMDHCPDHVSQITFGIEYEEMVKLCFDDCDPDNASVQECSVKSAHVKSESQAICDELKLVKTSLLLNEKELYWKEPDVKYCENNHLELTNYFASLWKECERNPDSESSQNRDIKIYQDV